MKHLFAYFLYLITYFLILFMGNFAFAEPKPSWFCTEESGKRSGNVLSACGSGEATIEGQARQSALEHAFREYHSICSESSDCNGHEVSVEPKRLTCVSELGGGWWKCYRLIEVTIKP